MNIRNCKKCGKMFNFISGEPICPACKEAAEAKFQEVKKFVQDNKQASIDEIVRNCDVDQKMVKQWIREERLFFSDDSPVKINCEVCGAQIPTGRFCEKCKKETANVFSNTMKSSMPKPQEPAPSTQSGVRMHTFQR